MALVSHPHTRTAKTTHPLTHPKHSFIPSMQAVDFGSILKFSIPAHMACEALMPPNCSKSLYLFRFDVHSPLMHGAWCVLVRLGVGWVDTHIVHT